MVGLPDVICIIIELGQHPHRVALVLCQRPATKGSSQYTHPVEYRQVVETLSRTPNAGRKFTHLFTELQNHKEVTHVLYAQERNWRRWQVAIENASQHDLDQYKVYFYDGDSVLYDYLGVRPDHIGDITNKLKSAHRGGPPYVDRWEPYY